MLECDTEIINKLGLHARAAAKLVKLCSGFDSDVNMEKAGRQVNCKSIMGVMMLAAGCGSKVRITTEGSDEDVAMKAVRDLIEDKFGEDE